MKCWACLRPVDTVDGLLLEVHTDGFTGKSCRGSLTLFKEANPRAA